MSELTGYCENICPFFSLRDIAWVSLEKVRDKAKEAICPKCHLVIKRIMSQKKKGPLGRSRQSEEAVIGEQVPSKCIIRNYKDVTAKPIILYN